nr:long chain alpha-neurotoxins (LsIII-isoform) [Laticauda semifasciata]
MKTLLLTLVVVTIVCLDLGYTRECYLNPHDTQTCPSGQEKCYVKSWCNAWCSSRGKVLEFGCAATCPSVNTGTEIKCCSADKCNTYP